MNKQKNLYRLKSIKRNLRNLGFVLDDYATYVDKKEVSFRHPIVYTGMVLSYLGLFIVNEYHHVLFLYPF